ncbi:DNA cytosine methyltransferase [Butyrivibrio sp. INlla16]|uniref:DNA cytosine methyltransferase n=1 Tax=Butyrivibrio sp. INlla16 TaxID=1520807 RepID=UPI00088EC335|nr:DNA cytosine methyltransferase [Butyrivibrio sp. INlla16]SDB13191.1 DNA (cytosine-5)-methyltransferase 1 [Butyrivibrio sp. INlla16]
MKKKEVIDLSYINQQVNAVSKKTNVTDKSIDNENVKDRLLKYYELKFDSYDLDKFEYDFIDLFCGAGGLSVGLEQAGFRPVVAVDKDQAALSTYRFNRPWMKSENIINEDIRKLVSSYTFPHVPLVVGGPPCQGFSVVNKQKKEHDERNELYKFYVHAVEQAKPEIFLMENVEGILKVYDAIKSDFANIGYSACEPLILSPKDFGFPQSRKRAFILGIKDEYKSKASEYYELFKSSIESEKGDKKYTLWDAIGDLPKLEAKTQKNSTWLENAKWGYTISGTPIVSSDYSKKINYDIEIDVPVLNHKSKYNNARDIEIYGLLQQGEKSDAESIQEINPYKNRADIFRDKFDKLVANEPCKAITAHMYYDCNMYIHPNQARGLTPREAARVQGFPDDYFFLGSPNEWYRQIGNAVSPLMARVLAKSLNKVLRRIYADGDN